MSTEPVPPPRRKYEPRKETVQASALDDRLRFWLPPLIVGGIGLIWVISVGLPIWIVPVMAVVTMVLVQTVLGGASWLIGEGALGTSGSGTPYQRGYSAAETLAIQGKHVEAIAAYEGVIADTPQAPEPYLAIARLYKKQLHRPEDAAFWFRRARREAAMSRGQDLATSREIIELFLASDDRQRAIPELARMIERFADTPEKDWAEGLLQGLKSEGD